MSLTYNGGATRGELNKLSLQIENGVANMDSKSAKEILNLQLHWISTADSKVIPIFALNTGILGIVAATAPPLDLMGIFDFGATAITAGFAFASIWFLLQTLLPNTREATDEDDHVVSSDVFFLGITSRSIIEYEDQLVELTEESLTRDIARQIHRNAEIAAAKHANVQKGTKLAMTAAGCWLVFLYLVLEVSGVNV